MIKKQIMSITTLVLLVLSCVSGAFAWYPSHPSQPQEMYMHVNLGEEFTLTTPYIPQIKGIWDCSYDDSCIKLTGCTCKQEWDPQHVEMIKVTSFKFKAFKEGTQSIKLTYKEYDGSIIKTIIYKAKTNGSLFGKNYAINYKTDIIPGWFTHNVNYLLVTFTKDVDAPANQAYWYTIKIKDQKSGETKEERGIILPTDKGKIVKAYAGKNWDKSNFSYEIFYDTLI